MIVWQLRCYLVHIRMLQEDMILDYKNRAKYDLRKFFFTNRVVSIWYSLPEYVVHADTVNCFKSRLDKFWSIISNWYITFVLKLVEPEAEVKLYIKYHYIWLP